MASMQNFLSWIKAKSKKPKTPPAERGQVYAPVPDSPTSEGEEGFFHHGASRDSVCRASMKLPPIPAGELGCQILAQRRPHRRPMMGVASLRNTDSPAHIYEEIPNHLVDDADNCSDTNNIATDSVNVTNLDFAQAKDFGAFMVVPIRSNKLNGRTHNGVNVHHVETNNNKSEQQPDSAPPPCDISNTPQCHNPQTVSSSFYPADSVISSDSGVTDLGPQCHHPDFSHCGRCRRPHGIFNGISLGGELDAESLELQTYFNKHMLQECDDPEGSVVDRFLIVPSRSELTTTSVEEVHEEGPSEEVVTADHDNSPVEIIPDMTQSEPPQGSDSNDTCNEYDLRSSDRSSTSQSRPGSYAFDSGSSLYAFSNNEKDGVLSSSSSSGISGMMPSAHHRGTGGHKPQESDSSNDTFSEYDLHASPEYEYYLSKASHNLWLKKDVMRVIRESESSEYETTSDVALRQCSCGAGNLDSGSLTTVTSLSDLSLSDKDSVEHRCHQKHSSTPKVEAELKQCTCECQNQQGKPTRQRTKTKTKHSGRVRSERRQAKELSSSEASASDVPAWERPERKGSHGGQKHSSRRRTSSRKTAELYCLPDFSPGTTNMVEEPERLSCRATDFTPPQSENIQHKHYSAARQAPAAVPQPRLQPRRAPQQNRMLSDLMKMNHDRLLVLF